MKRRYSGRSRPRSPTRSSSSSIAISPKSSTKSDEQGTFSPLRLASLSERPAALDRFWLRLVWRTPLSAGTKEQAARRSERSVPQHRFSITNSLRIHRNLTPGKEKNGVTVLRDPVHCVSQMIGYHDR